MLNITPMKAAWQIYRDFHLNQPVDMRQNPETKAKIREKREKRAKMAQRYSELCDVAHEADERLMKYTPETIDTDFDILLGAKAKADQELNLLWEEMKREHT